LLSLLILGLECIVDAALATLTLGALRSPLLTTLNSAPEPYFVTYVAIRILSSTAGLAVLHGAPWIPSGNTQTEACPRSLRPYPGAFSQLTDEMQDRRVAPHPGPQKYSKMRRRVYHGFTAVPALLDMAAAVVVFMIGFELALGVVVGVVMIAAYI
jgi:hypothetical protein